ncbi:MAG: hypothetical protein K2V38_14395 [Gemmataceae bacterium]|nr:hypothetical protein [Gemmataceae bacterium]
MTETETQTQQVATLTLADRRDPLHTLHFTFTVTGEPLDYTDWRAVLANPNHSADASIRWRNLWQARRRVWGDRERDWRALTLSVAEQPIPEGKTSRPGATVTVEERADLTQPPTQVSGLWDANRQVRTAGGQAVWRGLSQARLSEVASKWIFTGPAAELDFQGDKDQIDRAWYAVVVKAAAANWDVQKYGPLADYALKIFTYSTDLLGRYAVSTVSVPMSWQS